MPPVMTTSAQATSASLKSSVLRLISRTSQDCGNIAATVISPSGAAVYRAPSSLQKPTADGRAVDAPLPSPFAAQGRVTSCY